MNLPRRGHSCSVESFGSCCLDYCQLIKCIWNSSHHWVFLTSDLTQIDCCQFVLLCFVTAYTYSKLYMAVIISLHKPPDIGICIRVSRCLILSRSWSSLLTMEIIAYRHIGSVFATLHIPVDFVLNHNWRNKLKYLTLLFYQTPYTVNKFLFLIKGHIWRESEHVSIT